ncbi:MAG TPA: hypothetical protein O0W79_02405 [Methanocorpusculum sp.]|nr:hypothetical protein [Methanocorpusculum sp.]
MTEVDIRDRVEDDRGLIKKIQLIIPGYRGYRQREDIRIADSMLRSQVADQLKNTVVLSLENARSEASKEMELDLLNDIAAVLSKAQMLEEKIRHAEQGYTGISSGVRLLQEELNRIYEYDLGLLEGIDSLSTQAKSVEAGTESGNFADAAKLLKTMKADIVQFIQLYEKRLLVALQLNVV